MKMPAGAIVLALLSAAFALLIGCGYFTPLATSLPEGATAEHRYLAVLEDYVLFSGDVNAYLRLPSVGEAQAVAIDRVMDGADARVRKVEALRAGGTASEENYAMAAALLQEVARTLCIGNPEVSASCEGR